MTSSRSKSTRRRKRSFTSRYCPSLKRFRAIPAGLFGMRFLPFLIWSTIGTAGWTSLLAIAGYLLAERYTKVDEYLGPVSTGVVVALLLWYLFRVVTWKPSRRP